MIIFIINALKIIFVLGFLVFIHEGGHFIVAKLCKVKVNEFSIGFGPTIWKKEGKVTKYAIRLIPLGGYVNLEGESEESDEEGSYSRASIPKRMAIVVAGAFVNIIFALIVYFLLIFCLGNNTSLVIDNLIPQYAAESAGIQANDEIIKINGKKLYIKSDLDKILKESNGEELVLTINRNQEEIELKLNPTKKEYKSTGIYLKSTDSGESTKVIAVASDSIAEKVGIKANDEIIKINEKEVKNQNEIIGTIEDEEVDKISIIVKRGNEELSYELEPDINDIYYIGVYFKKAEDTFNNRIYYAIFETKDFCLSIFENLKMIFGGKAKIDQLMGPIGISEVVVNTNQVKDFIYILALISLSLGITNLLPIPALDGGKLLLLIIELIRRKKLNEKTEMNIQLFGFILLIALSIYVTYNDILRIL